MDAGIPHAEGIFLDPSTTTISTVAVQAGKAKIVLAVLKSRDYVQVRIEQMEPDIFDVGSTLEETRRFRQEHDELLNKLSLKQNDVIELLSRADQLASENESRQEVFQAMVGSLADAWKDLNKQLEHRKNLLDRGIAFHESALMFSRKMDQAKNDFTSGGRARDVEDARRLLQQHQDLKKSILESSMCALLEGQQLLDSIADMSCVMRMDEAMHATTSACYGVEHLLELMQDRRRQLEELWLLRKARLEQYLQMMIIDAEVNKIFEWFEQIGDVYLSKTELGDNFHSAQALREDHIKFEHLTKEIQEKIIRLVRMVENLDARMDTEEVRRKLVKVDEKSSSFALQMDDRRKNLTMAKNFFSLAQIALSKLDDIEFQMTCVDPTLTKESTAERLAYLMHVAKEMTNAPLHEAAALLKRVRSEEAGVAGVTKMQSKLLEKLKKLSEICKETENTSMKTHALERFNDKFNMLQSWLRHVVMATLHLHGNMGANHSASRDFLELHEKLSDDLKLKRKSLEEMLQLVDELNDERQIKKGKKLEEDWNEMERFVQERIRLASVYVAFHKKAQQLAIEMDVLEEYLKLGQIDTTQDSDMQRKQQNVSKIDAEFADVEAKGKAFITTANEVKVDSDMDTKHTIVVVETILNHFKERKFLISEYYENWKAHVTTKKQSKEQWMQFVQDAKKSIDWMVKVEKELFDPNLSGFVGNNLDETIKIQEKLTKFEPTALKAQDEVERLLKRAELLSLEGSSKEQRDQIVNELLRIHTRFQARINEYKILLNMAENFFKNLKQLDDMIVKTELSYNSAELTTNLTSAQMALKQHSITRKQLQQMLEATSREGDEIVLRVRQQDSESAARDSIQRILKSAEDRRMTWERNWQERKALLEHNLQMCQFLHDLKQLDKELDELQRHLDLKRGCFGNSSSSLAQTTRAFELFEKSAQLVGNKVKSFTTTANTIIEDPRYDSAKVKHHVDEVVFKWNKFMNSIADNRKITDEMKKFYDTFDECEEGFKNANAFLTQTGKSVTNCRHSKEVDEIIGNVKNYWDTEKKKIEDNISKMNNIVTSVYGHAGAREKMQPILNGNADMQNMFLRAIEELHILRDNLQKKKEKSTDCDSALIPLLCVHG